METAGVTLGPFSGVVPSVNVALMVTEARRVLRPGFSRDGARRGLEGPPESGSGLAGLPLANA